MALTKLSLTDEQVEEVMDLASKGYSGSCISKKIGVTQPKLWRNMEILGLNKKKKIPTHNKKKPSKYFRWEDYKDKSIV